MTGRSMLLPSDVEIRNSRTPGQTVYLRNGVQ